MIDLLAQINFVLLILKACFFYRMYMFVSHTGSERTSWYLKKYF